jgi:hypothetical protein
VTLQFCELLVGIVLNLGKNGQLEKGLAQKAAKTPILIRDRHNGMLQDYTSESSVFPNTLLI